MAGCSAPGKLILFGEHAVVFGQPALSTAIDLRTETRVRPDAQWLANGRDLDEPRYAYIKAAVEAAGASSPLSFEVHSSVPEGSGLGSSAAVTVSTLGALHRLHGTFDPPRIAREAFDVELAVQGRASPIDTTTATAGGAILALPEKSDDLLWSFQKGERRWFLHRRSLPSLRFVVGFTGISAATGPLVANVRDLVESSAEAEGWVEEIGEITTQALRALQAKDLPAVGELMNRNHELLNALGVGHPLLDRLVDAARPTSFGAKLTGAGGGGSIVAIAADPEATRRAIEAAGGRAYVVHSEPKGAMVLA